MQINKHLITAIYWDGHDYIVARWVPNSGVMHVATRMQSGTLMHATEDVQGWYDDLFAEFFEPDFDVRTYEEVDPDLRLPSGVASRTVF